MRAIWRTFRNRNLALLWIGQTISMAGDAIYQLAMLWLMLEMTDSAGVTGLVALSAYLPTLIVGVWAGAVVDRTDRRRVMIAADAVRALLVTFVPLLFVLGRLGPWELFAITFMVATGASFFNPARDALVPSLVGDGSELLRANALIQSSWMFALFVAPAAGLLLVQWRHTETHQLFYLDACTYAVSMLCIIAITTPRHGEAAAKVRGSFRADVRDGLRYAMADRRLRWLLLITAFDNLFIMGPATIGAAVFVRETLRCDVGVLMLIQVSYAVGMIAGTLILPLWQKRFNHGRIILIGMVLDGLTFVPLFWVTTVAGTCATIVVHSMAIPLVIVGRPSLVQEIVPKRLQGRVFGMIGVMVVGFTAISTGITGMVAEVVDMSVVYAVIGVGAALCGVWGWATGELRDSGSGGLSIASEPTARYDI